MVIRLKKHKYSAVKSNGFASKLENAVYQILKIQEKAGEIKDLRCQHAVELTRAKIRCKIDFSYIDTKTNETVFAEAKGVVSDRWRIFKKLWKHYGLGTLIIYKGTYKKPYIDEIIKTSCNINA